MRFRIAMLAVFLCCGFSAMFAFQAHFKEYKGEEENPAPVPKLMLNVSEQSGRSRGCVILPVATLDTAARLEAGPLISQKPTGSFCRVSSA